MKANAQIFLDKGYAIKHVDLGGGLGVNYSQDQEILNLELIKSEMNKCYIDVPYKLSFEPGRYLVANAGILVTTVITIKNNGGIVPHVDAQRKYLSLMLYFPDEEKHEIEYGTTFWNCSTRNHENKHISNIEKIKIFKKSSEIEFKTPFNKNCLYGFSRNDLSWHTVEPTNISDNYVRKSININFYYNN